MGQCDVFYVTEFPWCTPEVVLLSDLPNGDYVAKITDKFNRVFFIEVSAIDGETIIDLTGLPDSLLTPFAGTFVLEILPDQQTDQPIILTICDVEYGGVSFALQQSNTVPDSFSIGCP